ncbi:MAG TPA: tRNA 2-thiouridine(34) synthase MnmA [Candidatus Pacearchaeota archaeon]|nr:tRNA 2-thiouridine(34) synthase MnmA [Candidatus Pacearchaeota archaeon]
MPKVLLAMSGGIDSGMAASILKDQGYDVIGVFMRLNNFLDENKARKIAKILNIDFKVIDLRKDFKKLIINCFLEELKKGNTPNPCVVCNELIKFKLFIEKTKKLNSDFIATGHYATIKNKRIFKPKDSSKDQTYFLWRINNLDKILFPLGDKLKKDLIAEAQKKKFPVFPYKESQEICFIPGSIEDFLKKRIKNKKGNIIDEKGRVLGIHNGLWFYTIGQRKGIGLSGGPYYVIKKDIKNNSLIVSKNEKFLIQKEVKLKNINWINKQKLPIKIKAKIRYGQKEVSGILLKKGKTIILRFNKGERAITPGQSAVFYKGKEMIGGGIII